MVFVALKEGHQVRLLLYTILYDKSSVYSRVLKLTFSRLTPPIFFENINNSNNV